MDRKDNLKNLLVLGNGFDLSLGFKTKYSDFVESDIWRELYTKHRAEVCQDSSLIDYLNEKRETEKWFDIEQSLLDYVSRRDDGLFVDNLEQDRKDYEKICTALVEYIANELYQEPQNIESSIGRKLLSKIDKGKIYTFNYTPMEKLNDVLNTGHHDSFQVHGEINPKIITKRMEPVNSVILGFETDDIDNIAPGYSFMIKTNNPLYKSSNIVKDLLRATNVIIFGHSINKIDYGYFEDYFNQIAKDVYQDRSLTIFTWDESSKNAILDSLRQHGISILKLYSHIDLRFFLTKDMDEDSKEFDEFIEKINDYKSDMLW